MPRTARRDDSSRMPPKVQPTARAGDTLTGIVARVVGDRGFCFIHADGQDYFCHFSAITNAELKDLVQGVTRVKFLASETAKGLRAEQVEVVR